MNCNSYKSAIIDPNSDTSSELGPLRKLRTSQQKYQFSLLQYTLVSQNLIYHFYPKPVSLPNFLFL